MSDFHDALRRAAQQHGEVVAPGLSADAVVTSSVDGISRGRRRRARTHAGVGALGVVAIGVAGWLVLPLAGVGDSEPAVPDAEVNAGPWRYEVGTEGEVSDPVIMLRGEDRVMCGDELDLTPGVTVHRPEAFDSALWIEAGLASPDELLPRRYVDYSPPPEEVALFNNPVWVIMVGGEARSTEATPLLLDGGSVVGVGQGLHGESPGGGEVTSGAAGILAPEEGQCEDSSHGWGLNAGDAMDSVIVAQWWAASSVGTGAGGTLLATIVVDPNEGANTTEAPRFGNPSPGPVASASAAPDGLAAVRDPEGSTYQAFVVERPQPGCAPLADLRAAGHPSTKANEYTVDVPGVADALTGELWGAEPVVTLPEGEDPWYQGLDAWLVAEDVDLGIQDPPLDWTSLSVGGWALSPGGVSSIHGDDCAYVQPIPQIDGAVFLVIDGVDWDVTGLQLEPNFPGDDYQTWVYLGEAN